MTHYYKVLMLIFKSITTLFKPLTLSEGKADTDLWLLRQGTGPNKYWALNCKLPKHSMVGRVCVCSWLWGYCESVQGISIGLLGISYFFKKRTGKKKIYHLQISPASWWSWKDVRNHLEVWILPRVQRAHGQGEHFVLFLNRLIKLLGFSEFSINCFKE